jgi:hypothetical protein
MEISSCACAACIFFSAFAIDYLYAVSVCFQLNHMGFFSHPVWLFWTALTSTPCCLLLPLFFQIRLMQ